MKSTKIMNTAKFLTFITLFTIVLLAKAEAIVINTPNEVAVPTTHHTLLYTINAEYAIIIKESHNPYQIVLHHVDKNIGYRHDSSKQAGIYSLTEFINTWQTCKDSYPVEADLTGIQVNNKTIGHTQFHANVLLSQPDYNAAADELRFHFVTINKDINMSHFTQFSNATVFIDGHHVCSSIIIRDQA